jgi:hypothetical protein
MTNVYIDKRFHRLHANPRCPGFVHDLLNLAQHHLLVVKPEDRASLKEDLPVLSAIDHIHTRVIASEAYATGLKLERLKGSSSETSIASGTQQDPVVRLTKPNDSDSTATASNSSAPC